MLHIVLVHPQIPPNTGNIMRLARNCGARLHLIEPLGFQLDNQRLRRAGLDYADTHKVAHHDDWETYLLRFPEARRFTYSTKNSHPYTQANFRSEDHLVFGSETSGLPEHIRRLPPADQQLRLPMVPDNRSLNLANAVAIATYEAWRQLGFAGAAP